MFGEKYKLLRGSRNAQVIAAAVSRVAVDGQVVSAPPAQDVIHTEAPSAVGVTDLDWMDTVNVSASVGLGFEDPLASLGLTKLPPIPVRSETSSSSPRAHAPKPIPAEDEPVIHYTLPKISSLDAEITSGTDIRKRLITPDDYRLLERELNTSGKVPDWLKNSEERALARDYLMLRNGQANARGWSGL